MIEMVRDETENVSGYATRRHNEAYGSVTRVVIASSRSLPQLVQQAFRATTWNTTDKQQQGHFILSPNRPYGDGPRPPTTARLPSLGSEYLATAAQKDVAMTVDGIQSLQQHRRPGQRRSDHIDERSAPQQISVVTAASLF